jgi:colanic acid/amylovoran biosynthesis glycosyltransferase
LAAAIREFSSRPVTAVTVLWEIVSRPRNFGARLRNALIFPKALAVARLLRGSGVSHIHAYWLSTPATVAYVASRLTGIEWSATGHRWDLVDNNIRSIGPPNAGFVESARFIRAISEKGRQLVLTALGASNSQKAHVVHLGVAVPSPIRLGSRDATNGPVRLACIATLTAVKGHTYLLSALRKAKDAGTSCHCVLFGVGPLGEEIRRMARELDLSECVEMLPQIPHAELLQRLHGGEFDGAILTSIDEGLLQCEGIPVALIEAMAAGLPCIATRSGGISELVDGTNGMLAEPKDTDGIAAAVVAFGANASLRRALGKRARERVEADFCVEKTVAKLAGLIRGENGDQPYETSSIISMVKSSEVRKNATSAPPKATAGFGLLIPRAPDFRSALEAISISGTRYAT